MTTSADDLVSVYQTTDVGRAEVLRTVLASQGIDAFVENENQAGLSGVLECRVLVRVADEADARSFIIEHEPHAE